MKTKQINNYTTKMKVGLTINKILYKKFVEISEENSINKSSLIEKFIEKWVEEHKNN